MATGTGSSPIPKKGLCGSKAVSATAHHRHPGADLDAFGKAGPAGKHLESSHFPHLSAYVCLLGVWGFSYGVFVLFLF